MPILEQMFHLPAPVKRRARVEPMRRNGAIPPRAKLPLCTAKNATSIEIKTKMLAIRRKLPRIIAIPPRNSTKASTQAKNTGAGNPSPATMPVVVSIPPKSLFPPCQTNRPPTNNRRIKSPALRPCMEHHVAQEDLEEDIIAS